MRYYLDCEFNGFGGELISMALVGDNDAEFYEVIEIDSEYEPWVAENVAPHLDKPEVCTIDEFREKLVAFLRAGPGPVEIVCDWPADVAYLMFMLLGQDHSETVMIPMTITIVELDEVKSVIPHHALWDARAIRMAVKT